MTVTMEKTITSESRLNELESKIASLSKQVDEQKLDDKVSIICFSGEWDKLFAALSLASGSLALGKEVHLFFTFWSVSALRKTGDLVSTDKSLIQKMFNKMLPCGIGKAPLSKFNLCGLGKFFMKGIMKKKGVDDIDILFKDVKELGAKIHICDTSTELFGLKCSELIDGDKMNVCGATTFLSHGFKSQMILFI